MKKMNKRLKTFGKNLFIYTLTLSMLLPNFSVMSYAEESNETAPLLEMESSIGSVNMEDDGVTVGVDKDQNQKTEYSEELEILTEEDQTQSAKVYVTQASSFAVVIPKVIILDGQAKNADYRIGVKGDLAGKAYVDVLAQPSFWMYDIVGVKSPQKATVTQNNHMFVSSNLDTVPSDAINGVNSDTFMYTDGSINCVGITAGSWAGQFNFVIGAFRDFENPVVMATDGTVLEVTTSNLYLGEDYQGTKNAQVTVNGALLNQEPVEPVQEEPETSNESAFANFIDMLTLTQDVYADDELLVRAGTAQSLEWSSSNDKILVDQNGNVSLADGALAGDVATITVTYKGVESNEPGVVDREDISVSFNVSVFDIVMSNTELELATGEQGTIVANITPANLSSVLKIDWKEPDMMDGVGFNVEDNTTMNIDVSRTAIDDNNGILVASTEDYDKTCRLVVLPNHEHTYQVTASGTADCYNMGYTTYTCSSCDASTEGHTYTENTPKLEHTMSDGHFCDLCDDLIVPYKKGDYIRRNVNGTQIKFTCVDPEYVDSSGKKGAYFLSREVFPQVYGSDGSLWANSTARAAINGANSDKSRLMLTDTTVTEYADGAFTGNNATMSSFSVWPIAEHKQTKTEDYFFYPSLREVVTYYEDYLFPTGYKDNQTGMDIDPGSNYYEHIMCWYYGTDKYPDGLMVFNFRTSGGKSASEYSKYTFFFYSDGSTISSWLCGTGWQVGTNSKWLYARTACVIEQNLDNYENGQLKEEGWKKGDVIEKTVAGENLKFVCVAENYFDESGSDVGALFLATDIIGASKTKFDATSSEWASSDLRAYLNGSNSDTSGLVKVNTTVTEKATTECRSWHGMNVPDYGFVDIDNPIATEDYFFVLSARELQIHQGYMLSSTGEMRDMHLKWAADKYGYYTRTPFGNNGDTAAYVLSDAKYHNTLGSYKVNNNLIGVRPACVLPN